MNEILNEIGILEILCQLSEESAELSQAGLKYRRALNKNNPTPKSEKHCRAALLEEIADVQLCIGMLPLTESEEEKIVQIMHAKLSRWKQRIDETK